MLSASLHRLRPRSASCAPGGLPGSTVSLLWSGQAQGSWTPQPSPNLCSLSCFRRPLSTHVAAGHTPVRARVCSSHTVPSATGSSPVQLQATACSPRICIHRERGRKGVLRVSRGKIGVWILAVPHAVWGEQSVAPRPGSHSLGGHCGSGYAAFIRLDLCYMY